MDAILKRVMLDAIPKVYEMTDPKALEARETGYFITDHGETLWGIMQRVEGKSAGIERYRLWREANPDIGDNALGPGEVVRVPKP